MKRDPVELASVEVIPNLPDSFHPERGNPLPPGLIGAKIIQVGTVDRETRTSFQAVDGGGLVIDYIPENAAKPVRAVLGFNESGMWTVYCGPSDA